MNSGIVLASGGLLLSVIGCAGNPGGIAVVQAEVTPREDSLSVVVKNDHWEGARVCAVYGVGGSRYPLGVVGGEREAGPFTIPYDLDPLTMEVVFVLGAGRYLSDRIDVSPGDVVELHIPGDIATSGSFAPVP